MTEQEFDRELKKEKRRLTKTYKDVSIKRKDLLKGLIENAAFTCLKLRELQIDLQTNGLTEMFSQSETQKPYSRKRPEADLYNTMLNNYLKYIHQLNDMLPKEVEVPKNNNIDLFDEFVNSRDAG